MADHYTTNLYPSLSDYLFKVILLGDAGVGKSSINRRYVHDDFEIWPTSTLGGAFVFLTQYSKSIIVERRAVKLEMWDTAGAERYNRISRLYYRAASGIVLTFDVSNRSSFERVKHWFKEADEYVAGTPCILVGNKCDLNEQRVVAFEEGMQLAEQLGTSYTETSAKTGRNVAQMFNVLASEIIDRVASAAEERVPPSRSQTQQDRTKTPETQTSGSYWCAVS